MPYAHRMYFCSMSIRIFIVAGELSGDAHGALLMRELKLVFPHCIIDGIGGPAMQAEGLQSLHEFSQLNVSGFWEVVRNYSTLRSILNTCKHALIQGTYDVFIAVDYPGFNMRLGSFARSHGIPSVCYIAPQLWAWGESRIEQVKKAYDILLTVLPFEPDFFAKHGISAPFIGHPLLDRPEMQSIAEKRDNSMICLMPGSRVQELQFHLPILKPIAQTLSKDGFDPVFCVPKHLISLVHQQCGHDIHISHDTQQIMKTAKAGIVKVGTSTLEAALMDMPFLSYYSTSWISYHISKSSITVPWIALPNILLHQSLIPEYIQDDAQPEHLIKGLGEVLSDAGQSLQREGFSTIRNLLGGPGASYRAAASVREFLSKGTIS